MPNRYKFDLDLPESERWLPILKDYKDIIKGIEKEIDEELYDTCGLSLKLFALKYATKWNYITHHDELKCIAKETGIDLGKIVAMQFMYEQNACCTSIVVEDEKTRFPIHIRTMDWDAKFLKKLVIELEFYKDKKPIFIATTWAGYVGVLTAMRIDAYSLSVNYRETENPSLWTNLKQIVNKEWTVGFFIRNLLENRDSYYGATKELQSTQLCAPCYFIIAGLYIDDGMIIIRDCDKTVRTFKLSDMSLVQTNVDHHTFKTQNNILESFERGVMAEKMLSDTKKHDEELLWKITNTKPITNDETIYTTFMSARLMKYETKVEK